MVTDHSSQTHPETTLQSEVAYQGVFLTIRKDEVQLSNGLVRQRDVLNHPGGVMAVPELPDGRLLMLRQYRYALKDYLYEFPAGKVEPGEERLDTMKRELEEETGYAAGYWQEITSVVTAPGFCDEWITVYWAKNLTPIENPSREEDETIELVPMTVTEVAEAMADQRIVDAKTIVGFSLVYGLAGHV